MNNLTISELDEVAKQLRMTALTMIYKAQSGHPGGSLSAADIMASLYFHAMNIDEDNYKDETRDRFVLSKGHVCPILYSTLIQKKIVPKEEMNHLRKEGAMFQGHPDMKKCPGIDISTGSLGQGISCAVGMALSAKRSNKDYYTYTLLGDGECNEGQVWEACQTASKYDLDNLFVIVDNNKIQNDGKSSEIMPTRNLKDKFSAFGFESLEVNGHDIKELTQVLDLLRTHKNGLPKAIVCNTIKGKGVSYMENIPAWHGMAPNDEEFEKAMSELRGV